jgi:hypothetical protein
MCMARLSHLMAIVPVALLLTVSFFVLFTLRKIEEKGLRIFGCVVVSFLWLATLVVFSSAVYKIAQAPAPMKSMMSPGMKMDSMSQMMPRINPAVLAMPGMVATDKDKKRSGCSKCQANKGVIFKAE